MIKLIIIGAVSGLIFSLFLSFGPGFWGLVNNSIRYGFRKGVAFEVGVNASDIMMVVLALTFLNKDSITDLLRTPVASIIGGSVVIFFGVITILRRPTQVERQPGRIRVIPKGIPSGRELMFHGFALNSLNPSVWLYWLALAAVVKAEIHLTDLQTFAFFISMLLAELGGGVLKSRLASLLKNNLTESAMRGVSLFAGMILIALGGYLIGSMVMRLRNPEHVEKEPAEMVTQIINRSLNGSPRDTNVADTTNETFYFNQ